MSSFDWKLFKSLIKNINSYKMNRSMIGYSFEKNIKPISHQDIKLFSIATNDNNPAYFSEYDAPPFLLYKLTFPLIKKLLIHEKLNINLLKGVFADQKIIWHTPLKTGDQLKIKIEINNIIETPVGEKIEITGQGFNKDVLVVESQTGFIVRKKLKNRQKNIKQIKNLKEQFRIEMQTEKGQELKFAHASGDYNFIHITPLLAKLAGFKGTILHGACVMSMSCSNLIEKILNNDISQLISLNGRFGYPVYPGEKLILIGYEPKDENAIPFEVINSNGKLVFKNGLLTYK